MKGLLIDKIFILQGFGRVSDDGKKSWLRKQLKPLKILGWFIIFVLSIMFWIMVKKVLAL
jgi:hypothetical protein